MHPGQLLGNRRFSAMFTTQFLGALNDNLFRNALLVLVTVHIVTPGIDTAALVNLGAGLFIAPLLVLSPLAGQLADALERSRLIRRIKLAEVCVTVLGAGALLLGSVPAMLAALTLMGAQSAFFGPVKYAILPQLLEPEDLVGGNALVELGAFLAIALGTLAGGLAMSDGHGGPVVVSVAVVALAVGGYLSSRRIPRAAAANPAPGVDWHPWRSGAEAFRFARSREAVWLSIMGVSWFWFYAFLFLAQVTPYSGEVPGAGEPVASVLLATFCLGIGAGAMVCERLSGRRVELGLVPLGAVGMSVFALDLGLAWSTPDGAQAQGVSAFLARPGGVRVLLDIAALSVSAGVFVVPLYAYIQRESPDGERARIVAANNMLAALFTVMAAVSAAGFLAAGLSVPQLFITAAAMNAAVGVFIFTRIPEFLMRLVIWLLVHTLYRIDKQNLEHIPARGAAVLVCNHVSFVDALIIAAISPRPVRFLMDHRIHATPVLNFVFRVGRAIPIAPARTDPVLLRKAMQEVARALEDGDLVCLFPEGRITSDGELNPFQKGIEHIIAATPVPVVPLALRGLWGSFFSRSNGGAAMRGLPRRLWSRVSVVSAPPVPAREVSAAGLEARVLALRGEQR